MDNKIFWVIAGFSLIMSIKSTINQLNNEIKRTNKILIAIAKQVGVPEPDGDDEIIKLIVEGKKIEAIKKYRLKTGLKLKEAKEYVDSISEKIY